MGLTRAAAFALVTFAFRHGAGQLTAMDRTPLPIDGVLPAILETLSRSNRLVLAAPPGAGKTTRVPLAMLEACREAKGETGAGGRILILEPRRIAARAAAERMASELGERVGETVGLSTRIERKVSAATRIEVLTDGLFTRRILADPALEGVSAVVFDEFHERSLNVDLGLALACETQVALNDDLKLLVMSATLDTARLATVLDARVIASEGRMFPVETRYVGRPKDRLEPHVAATIRRALREDAGSVLVFLPGAAEIRRVAEALEVERAHVVTVHPLFGALSPKEQDAAIRPAPDGTRKVVLATDIAESALTIEGVRVVIDAGLARLPEASGRAGQTRLTTVRAALSSVDQRRGRAGRTAPGVCYRLWDEPETRGLAPHVTPEILRSDLAGLALALADWGERDPGALTWIDPPPAGAYRGARDRLVALGALTGDGALTERGREMAALPVSPHMAALIISQPTDEARALAAEIAALMSERGIGGQSADLGSRLAGFRRDRSQRATALRRQAARWAARRDREGVSSPESGASTATAQPGEDPGTCLAQGWPHAIARKRPGSDGDYITAGGLAGRLEPNDPLAKHTWLAVADSIGRGATRRITLAAPITRECAERCFPPQTEDTASYDPGTRRLSARRIVRMGAIILSETPLPAPTGEIARDAILAALAEHGFSATDAEGEVEALLARVALIRRHRMDDGTAQTGWPDWTAEALSASASDWLGTSFGSSAQIPSPRAVVDALKAQLPWPLPRDLETLAPEAVALPSGRRAAVTYTGEQAPLIEARVQELFGPAPHPSILDGAVPLTVSLLSPAQRQVALTRDLPAFWGAGYRDMAKDMRARYPKHDWPDDPASAEPHPGHTKARILHARGSSSG